jgi:glycosyltransferase involved in cell wall biosynthesis
MVKVSVVMSVYNEQEFLLDAIRSILNQTFKDFEFIIIDDGSITPIRPIIESFRDDRIKLFVNKQNRGLTASLNTGMFVSEGKYIARQDSDDVSERTRLFQQVRFLDTNQEIGLVGSSCTIIDEMDEVIDDWEAMPDPTNSLASRNKITHGSVMFRRSVMEDLGKYDEHFKYAQDYDYWLRISKKYQIRNLPSRLYQSRVHSKMIGQSRAEEQALYVILAQRKAAGSDNLNPLEYGVLTKKEKIRYHNMVAYSFLQGNDMVRVSREIDALLKIDPLNPENIILATAAYFGGRGGVQKTLNTYRKIRARISGTGLRTLRTGFASQT